MSTTQHASEAEQQLLAAPTSPSPATVPAQARRQARRARGSVKARLRVSPIAALWALSLTAELVVAVSALTHATRAFGGGLGATTTHRILEAHGQLSLGRWLLAALLLVAAVLLGAGGGLALAAGLGLTARIARPERRGALSAVFYACAYLGFAAPYITAVVAAATRVQVPLAAASALTLALGLRLAVATRRGQL